MGNWQSKARLQLVGGLLALAVPLFLGAVWLNASWRTGTEAIGEGLVRFDRLRSIAAYRQAPANDDTQNLSAELFLPEGTAAVVSADLLTQLKQMAAAQGIEVMRAGDLPPKSEGPLTLVGGSLQMTGAIANVYGFIQQVEAMRPTLFIDRLDLRSNGLGGNEDLGDTLLTVDMQVFGAVHTDAAPKDAGGG